jgi:predicted transcriptional regulator
VNIRNTTTIGRVTVQERQCADGTRFWTVCRKGKPERFVCRSKRAAITLEEALSNDDVC